MENNIIPQQLKIPEINFVLIEKQGKKPFQKDWQNKNIKFTDEELLNHISNGGNYGVRGGGEKKLIIVDFDNKLVQEECLKKLPETFSVKTGSGMLHLYYFSDDCENFKIFDENLNTLIDVQGEGKQVIGAGSIHPNGNKYAVEKDIPISFINYSELKAIILPYDRKPKKEDKKKERKENTEQKEQKQEINFFEPLLKEIKTKIPIEEVLKKYGVNTNINPTSCPFHSSKGGKCLGFKDETAHCFHCEDSWNVFTFTMKYENISFKEALKGLAKQANLLEKLNALNEEFKKTKEGKTKIALPGSGKVISIFARELSDVLKTKNTLFFRIDSKDVVEIGKIKLHKNGTEIYNGFIQIKPNRLITLIEKYVTPGNVYKNEETKELEFKEKSMGSDLANTLLQSEILQMSLPQINRIFTVPIPIIYNGELTFPKRGFDERFYSWMPFNAPEINPDMTLEEAKNILDSVFKEFCFDEKQDHDNAIAALLTPFLRGLFTSFSVRTPVFFYIANRERAGKDYLAGVTGILYEEFNIEESPINSSELERGGNTEELRKKILASMINGRKRIHFSNNKGFINNAVFEAIVTAEKYSDRLLGRNEILTFENELDFSLSGNTGITFTPDFANRCRFIRLFLDIEDANLRTFENPNLHNWVRENRELILSALYSLVKNWIEKGSPKGKEPFASFPQWSEICGGIMESAGYLNPCIQNKKEELAGGDTETLEMKKLFEKMYELYPEKFVSRDDIKEAIKSHDNYLFPYYDLNIRADQTKFWTKFVKFRGRILSNIRLIIKDLSVPSYRYEYMFSKE